MRLLVLVALAGCGGAPRPHSVTLRAPAAAAWTSATVLTHYSQFAVHNSMIGGSTTYDDSDVELVVQRASGEGRSIQLVQSTRDAFGASRSARSVARVQFLLRSSPDGAWVVISDDGGASWLLVNPDAMVVCRHLGLRGAPESFWSRLPAPMALEHDLVAAAIGTPGTLGLDHGNDELELRLARDWIVAQGDRPELAPLAAAMVLASFDNTKVDHSALDPIRARLDDPAMLAQIREAFEHPRDGHLVTGLLATEILWYRTDVPLQALLGTWLARAAAPGGVKIFEYEAVADGDWSFAQSVWNLARLVRRDHAVTPEAEQAAIAVIARAAKELPTAETRASAAAKGSPGRPWGMMKPAPQAAATYAIQVLIAAHTASARHAIEAVDFDRAAAPIAPRAVFADPLTDYEIRPIGHDLGMMSDVDGVFVYALSALADAW